MRVKINKTGWFVILKSTILFSQNSQWFCDVIYRYAVNYSSLKGTGIFLLLEQLLHPLVTFLAGFFICSIKNNFT